MLSAVIIAKDEADRIGPALASVAFCDEVLVLDAGSSDGTPDLARDAGARVVLTDWPGFVAQRNRAWAEAKGDWILAIDADEIVSDPLRDALVAAVRGDASGASMPRRNHWLGHRLSHGRWYPDRKVRLARRDASRWVGGDVHESLEVDGRILALNEELIHHPYRDLEDHLRKVARYAELGRRPGTVLDVAIRPAWSFLHGYLLQGGFQDGYPGLCVAAIDALYVLLKWAPR
jgi:glycosyltransferase involved in cell wall biosynthesis